LQAVAVQVAANAIEQLYVQAGGRVGYGLVEDALRELEDSTRVWEGL